MHRAPQLPKYNTTPGLAIGPLQFDVLLKRGTGLVLPARCDGAGLGLNWTVLLKHGGWPQCSLIL